MPNYGFNENEIISTQTIMIDKDGFYKVVNGASGGDTDSNISKEIIGIVNSDYGSYLVPYILIDNESDLIDALDYSTTEAVWNSNHEVYIALNPVGTEKASDYPLTVDDNLDWDAFATEHNITNDDSAGWLHWSYSSEIAYMSIGKNTYRAFDIRHKTIDQSSASIYNLFSDSTILEPYKIVDAEKQMSHYEFDMSIILLYGNEETGTKVFVDIVHVSTMPQHEGDPK